MWPHNQRKHLFRMCRVWEITVDLQEEKDWDAHETQGDVWEGEQLCLEMAA